VAAADAGLDAILVDEAAALGGQYYRQPATAAAKMLAGAHGPPGIASIKAAQQATGTIRLNTVAFDAAQDGIRVAYDNALVTLQLPAILAPGATERVVPVPGWTLPGVVSCGGAQILAKAQGVPIGKRVLVAGSGPFLLPVAAELIRLGARVVAIVEASRPGARLAAALLRNPSRLIEGARHLLQLLGRTPVLSRHAVVEIRGNGTVQEAVVARLDPRGHVRDGSLQSFACDAVCLSDGFLPATELAQLAGVATRWDPAIRAWGIDADPLSGRTAQRDVFAAGAAVDPLGGAQLADASGTLAAYTLAEQLGAELPPARRVRRDAAARKARLHLRFASVLRATYPTQAAWYERTTDETIVCRCEDVRAGEIRRASREGTGDINLVKRWTRAGMGLCQGRTCGASLAELVAAASGRPADTTGRLRPRPPLRPLPVSLLTQQPSAIARAGSPEHGFLPRRRDSHSAS
jgi:NADPH-dependent 2,4-dienoyl-CoA reductase/sulfur reductase-like enzyme